jgi:talin
LVAAATHSLVESANALVQGISSEEKLISSAKQVASSTAQLLVSCKVKADPDSASTKRLLVNKIMKLSFKYVFEINIHTDKCQ